MMRLDGSPNCNWVRSRVVVKGVHGMEQIPDIFVQYKKVSTRIWLVHSEKVTILYKRTSRLDLLDRMLKIQCDTFEASEMRARD
jgi:hypothetical protein